MPRQAVFPKSRQKLGDRKNSVTPSIILYTRAGCHLCEEAAALLARYGLAPQSIDIDADPALCERYNYCVPVVVIDGKERFRGRVNEVLLKRILAGPR
jgi:glutaredoxin